MKPVIATLCSSMLLVVLSADLAWGQNQNQQQSFVRPPQVQQGFVYRSPTVSPYLGLLRSGTPMWNNYYSLVRPEMQTQDTLRRQQTEQDRLAQENQRLQQKTQQLLNPATQPGANQMTGASRSLRPTGHRPAVMNGLGGRFMTR